MNELGGIPPVLFETLPSTRSLLSRDGFFLSSVLLHARSALFSSLLSISLFLALSRPPDDRRGAYYAAQPVDTSCAWKINTRASTRLDLDEQSANDVKVEKSLR